MEILNSKKKLEKATIIAEIGCNHMGDFEIAKQLILEAKRSGAHVAKFQKRNSKELLTIDQYNAPHPVACNSYGPTYGLHREALEFTIEQHKGLKAFSEDNDIIYSTSVWDMSSAQEIAAINPSLIKIPSATNTHFELLNWLAQNYYGDIHLSLGMTTHSEEAKIVDLFIENGRERDLILYACTSGYPVPMEDVCLLEIRRLIETYGNIVKTIGYSGHNLGVAVDLVAYTLGATHIERHFTMERTWKGTDHAASIEPEDLKRLARDLDNVSKAYTYKSEEILTIEKRQREKLKWLR
jgi:N-acetylneuraminate synthase